MRTFRQEVQLASLAKAGQKRRRAAQLAQGSDSDSGSAGAAPEDEAHIKPDAQDEAMARDQAPVRDSAHCHDRASDHGVDCALADDNQPAAGRTAGAGERWSSPWCRGSLCKRFSPWSRFSPKLR